MGFGVVVLGFGVLELNRKRAFLGTTHSPIMIYTNLNLKPLNPKPQTLNRNPLNPINPGPAKAYFRDPTGRIPGTYFLALNISQGAVTISLAPLV